VDANWKRERLPSPQTRVFVGNWGKHSGKVSTKLLAKTGYPIFLGRRILATNNIGVARKYF